MPYYFAKTKIAGPASMGWLKGIMLGPGDMSGNSPFGRGLAVGVVRSDSEGNPSTPSLAVPPGGFWRFKWGVLAGSQTISVDVKQASNTSPYPTVVVKANPAIGVSIDHTGTSTGGTGWVTIGPVTVSATSPGVLWVELHNNSTAYPAELAYFDNISSS